jgi:hypothetical protein
LKLCVTIALLGYILWVNDIILVLDSFIGISPIIWMSVLILYVFCVLISVLRLSVLLQGIRFRTLLYVRLVSGAYEFVLPGQLAVEGMRAYLLGKEEKEYSQPGAAVLVDKVVSIIALLLLSMVGLIATEIVGWRFTIVFCIVGVTLVTILFLLNVNFVKRSIHSVLMLLSRKIRILNKVISFVLQVIEHWQTYIKNKRLLVRSFIYGILFHLLCSFVGVLFTHGVGVGFNTFEWLWFHAVLTIALILPVTIGGMGVREAGMIGLLGLIGIVPEQALAVSFGFLALHLLQAIVGIGLEVSVTLRGSKANTDNKDEG